MKSWNKSNEKKLNGTEKTKLNDYRGYRKTI